MSEFEQGDTTLAAKYFCIVMQQHTKYYGFINRTKELEIDLTTLIYLVS